MEVRQSQIENDEIRGAECSGLQPFRGILGFEHREAVNFKARAKKPSYFRLVFDQEHDVAGFTHRFGPPIRKQSWESRAGRSKPLFPVPGRGSGRPWGP